MTKLHLLLGAAVGLLAAWAVAEALALWPVVVDLGYPEPPYPVALAVALPLPLLLVPRAPALAGLGLVALALARGMLDARPPSGSVDTFAIVVGLFVAEASARGRWPLRGAVLGALTVGASLAAVELGLGFYAFWGAQRTIGLVAAVVAAVGAGYALRDRRAESARLEAELARLRAHGGARVDALLAGERQRIAAELEGAVALLLHDVRPLGERAARARTAAPLASDMRAVQRAAREAMTEMRRALHLLRGPVPEGDAPDLATARAATRRTRVRHALGWAAPVALLAALGIADQLAIPPLPLFAEDFRGSFTVVEPAFGPVAPYLTALATPLPLLARARAPFTAAFAVSAALVGRELTGDLNAFHIGPYYVAPAAAFLCAAHARSVAEGVLVGAAAVGASAACVALEQVNYLPVNYAFFVLLPAVATAAGLLLRGRVATAARLRAAQEELDRVHESAARERLVAERLQAARELHDVVGHAVTVVGLQAAAAEMLAARDLARARDAAATVVAVTAEAERDLARLRAALGAEPEPAGPPPRLADVVERMRSAGLPVTLDQRIDEDALPRALSVTAFRIVQEALTNAHRHAGLRPVRVTVAAEDRTLVVEVVDAGPGARRADGAGRGLVGMRERVELFGGRFSAGPANGSGWRVRAELPF